MRSLITNIFLLFSLVGAAETIPVKNIEELNAANNKAQPGDIVVLQNGEWKNVTIKISAVGTKEQPITFKAQTPGKVLITGHSMLKIGGKYIIVDGLNFIHGYAGDDAVISFRVNKDQLANDCRVTNTAIIGFNNPKRMDENNWVLFYGKNNRLDHCSFKDKKNMGVLLAVILDDERSRGNYHEIDHNYFGRRPPLASNGGEIIRVGVSQHCQYNSNTQITNNLFEYCDGETEIVSIKSCSNMIQDNIFKESEGSLVLRHGDNNIVSGNLFFGNGKAATGGVRVINKGQVVRNNVFYKCRGSSFKAPIAVMNGIPNSPAHRYVQVTDAEIVDNVFYECSPLSFGEGSDAERTLPPFNVSFANNIFYNTKDPLIYTNSDEITGFNFERNKVSLAVKQELPAGFEKTKLPAQKLYTGAASDPLFTDISLIPLVLKDKEANTGASWFPKKQVIQTAKPIIVNCSSAEELYKQLERKEHVTIRLTGSEYVLNKPLLINKNVQFTGDRKKQIRFNTGNGLAVFVVSGNGNLGLNNLLIDGSKVKATHFITSDSSGYSDHFNLSVTNCTIENFSRKNGCEDLIYASKYMIADSIILRNNSFRNNNSNTLMMVAEKDDKGYYNAEKIVIGHNSFSSQNGTLLNIYRGGNDESTLGPDLSFSHNKMKDCNSGEEPLIFLHGVQSTKIFSNNFINCNPGKYVIAYRDIVRARHVLGKNILTNSGIIEKDQFVVEQ